MDSIVRHTMNDTETAASESRLESNIFLGQALQNDSSGFHNA